MYFVALASTQSSAEIAPGSIPNNAVVATASVSSSLGSIHH